jgi:hypothetical protein
MAKDAKTAPVAQGLKKPMCFVENKGQVTDQNNDPRTDVQYKLSTPGMNLYVGNGQLHYQFKKIEGNLKDAQAKVYRMDVTLEGANKNAKVISSDKQSYYENYFYPQFGEHGLQVSSFNKIIYQDIYPHIDWVLYIKNSKLEYDFVVHEGGKVGDIKMKYDGATALNTTDNGGISATTPLGTVEEKAPYTYESKSHKAVASNFKLDHNTLSFTTGAYQGDLTIDPYLQWSTYFGGTGEDVATSVKETSDGTTYVAGYSSSTGLATGTPAPFQSFNFGVTYDAFVAKYTAAGALSFATYFGGFGTNTQAMGIALDNAVSPSIYVTGYTTSAGLESGTFIHQGTNAGLNDAFVVKFNNSGSSRTWCTYYGGADNDYAYGITLDANNNIYITGQTASTTGIASGSAYQTAISGTIDAFLAKFNSTLGSLTWATYYGGSAQDQAYGVACDGSNNPVITGQTNSINGIATTGEADTVLNGTNDAFVAQFSPGGSLNWGTYFGGPGLEQANGVVCNKLTNDISIVGNTSSTTGLATPLASQTTFGGSQDAFVADFTTAGTLAWSTYAGGASPDYGQGICLDSFQNVVITGGTFSSAGIATAGSYQPALAGDYDAYVIKYTPYGQKVWGTYFGGTFYDYANAVACAPNDGIVIAGFTTSTSGISTAGAAQPSNGGGTYDAFVSKFYNDTFVVINQPFTDTLLCAGGTFNLNYTANFDFLPGNTFTAQLSNAAGSFTFPTTIGSVTSSTSGAISCSIPVFALGTGYRIRIVSSSPAMTSPDDLYNIDVVNALSGTYVSGTTPVCVGSNISLYDSSTYIVTAYTWNGPNGFTSNVQNPTIFGAVAADSGVYYVTTSHNGCPDRRDSVSIAVNSFTPPTPGDSVSGSCEFGTIQLFANPDTSLSGITYSWTGPNGFTSTMQNPTITDASTLDAGYYFVTDTFGACPSATNYVYVIVNSSTPATVAIAATPGDTICKNTEITFNATTTGAGLDPSYQWYVGGSPVVGAISNTFSSLDLVNGSSVYCELFSNAACPSLPFYSSNTITVTVIDNTPLAHITVSAPNVTLGQPDTFYAATYNPGTLPYYEWVVNGVAVTGITSDILHLTDTVGADTVTLILHTSNTCASPDSAVSNTIIINAYPATVPSISAFSNINLFPNPNSGTFNLSGDIAGVNAQTVSIEIENALGQTVYTTEASIANNHLDKAIDVNNIASGIYLLHIKTNVASKTIRFSISR